MDEEKTYDDPFPEDIPFGHEYDAEDLSANGQSLGGLIKEITFDMSNLVRKEVELAKQEVTELVRTKLLAVGLFVIGGVLGLLIAPFMLLTLIEVIAIWLPRWAATLIVTGLMVAVALLVVLVAKSKFDARMKPEKTIQSLKEDVAWAKRLKR